MDPNIVNAAEPPMDWVLDEDGCWNLHVGPVHVWLEPRPTYCDRGHWTGNVMGIGTLDEADVFPRYYMDLERAKLEMADWLAWRLKCEGSREPAPKEKQNEVRRPGSGNWLRSRWTLVGQMRAMSPGQSVTFTKELKKLPVGTAPGTYSQVLGGYALRGRPGCSWSYETFTAITSRGRLLVGCVMTLVTAERSTDGH